MKRPGRLRRILGVSDEDWETLPKARKLKMIDQALRGNPSPSERGALLLGKRFLGGEFKRKGRSEAMDFAKASERLTALRESLDGGALEETTSGWLKGPLNQIFLAKRDLDALKGSFYYRLHGRGSVKDDTRTDSGPYYTPAERAKVAAVEKKVLAFEQEIQDLLDKGHVLEREIKAIDKLMGLGHV